MACTWQRLAVPIPSFEFNILTLSLSLSLPEPMGRTLTGSAPRSQFRSPDPARMRAHDE